MKNTLLFLVLTLVLCSSCNKKTYSALYHDNLVLEQNDTRYYLPKDLLKFEIIYTLNEPRYQKGDVDRVLKLQPTKITIEDPIVITKLSVPDTSKMFVITGKQLSETRFVSMDIDSENSALEKTTSTSVNHKDSKMHDYSALTTSRMETKMYDAVIELKNNIPEIVSKKEAERSLNTMSFYKSQFKILNEDFQPYIKQYKVKYTVVIDPLQLYYKDGNWSSIEGDNVYHSIFPEHIFVDKGDLNDIITVKVTQPKAALLDELVSEEPVEGIIYRNTSPLNIEVALNDSTLLTDTLALTQLETFKTISVKDFEAAEPTSVLLFKFKTSKTSTDIIPNFLENTEPIDFNSSETIAESQIAIKKAYKEKLQNIDLLIEKLKERKAEL
ncbi:hypothetical protein DFQ09_10831 [Winogradskyella pacifica]|uniref:Uncharacterized protein n=1 Tax=Winogradskyella pacifica TaxID=664642 RepID=A0A3D9LLN5_9FLAO|nr:hypothetical protein [Winogradskyella pacifica]REE08155.1 hypothetical protein DFQ09_10831 [Winogradskyella pacifica]